LIEYQDITNRVAGFTNIYELRGIDPCVGNCYQCLWRLLCAGGNAQNNYC